MTADERERARAFLELQEGRGPVPVLDDVGIAGVLGSARRIAVVGASGRPDRPSHGVMRTLIEAALRPAASPSKQNTSSSARRSSFVTCTGVVAVPRVASA